MSVGPKRMTLSAAQVAVMNEAIAVAPDHVRGVASRISRGEAVPEDDAQAKAG
ncbi:MAG: hypothetical protein LH654_08920 [Thermoleophilia bacterium]|nr:hypothetical protein [Thermoleophilia bacterium]